jgi:hypothetical protein
MGNQQPSLELKRCKKCGEAKPHDDFPTYAVRGKIGRRGECLECRRAYQAAWARGEIQPIPEGECRTCRTCGAVKPKAEFAPIYGTAYRSRNCLLCARQEHTERMRQARAVDAEKYRGHQRAHRRRHLEKVRRQRRESGKRLKDEVFAAYGGYRCVCCGETHPSMLTLDHIDEDGKQHRNLLNGGRGRLASVDMYRRLKDAGFPTNIQVLCYNCNISKHRNRGTCGHKLKEGSTAIP